MTLLQRVVLLFTVIIIQACTQAPDQDPTPRDYSDTFSPLPQKSYYPTSNQYNAAKEQLGEFLFWDPIVSGAQNVSCASCHHPAFAWSDGRALSVGSDGIGLGPQRIGSQKTTIHSPTIMNTSFTGITISGIDNGFNNGGYFWDLRADSLEQQSIGPITNPTEMLGDEHQPEAFMEILVKRLQDNQEYVGLFEDAFDSAQITSDRIAQALATFERKIISPGSRFDQFLAGDTAALTATEIAGLNKFIDVGCARCHLGPMLADNLIHEDQSVLTGSEPVRTPSLQNISMTAPYMHDGSLVTLRDAIAIYEDRDDLEVTMGDDDIALIESFLRTLDSDDYYKSQPDYVPSGLAVGGD